MEAGIVKPADLPPREKPRVVAERNEDSLEVVWSVMRNQPIKIYEYSLDSKLYYYIILNYIIC